MNDENFSDEGSMAEIENAMRREGEESEDPDENEHLDRPFVTAGI